MMAGLLAMFFLIRGFHSHAHGIDESSASASNDASAPPAHDHSHCSSEHDHRPPSRSSWIGVAIGLSLHTLIDGAALAAAVADEEPGTGFAIAGLGTFLAVALHKPLDSLSITTLMLSQGWSSKSRQAVNLAYSLACPLGAALFMLGVYQFQGESSAAIGAGLAVAAGVFLCISLGDLLPEIEYHSHDRLTLSAALLAGVALAYAIGFIEPAHLHDGHPHESAGHSHHSHSPSPSSRHVEK
jgi:zinc and cadmium transporter